MRLKIPDKHAFFIDLKTGCYNIYIDNREKEKGILTFYRLEGDLKFRTGERLPALLMDNPSIVEALKNIGFNDHQDSKET